MKQNLDKALKVLKVWSSTSGVPLKRTIANLDRLERHARSKSRSPSPPLEGPNSRRARPKASNAKVSSPAGWETENKTTRKPPAGLGSPPHPKRMDPPLPRKVWDGDSGAGAAEAFRKHATDLNRRIEASGRRGVSAQQDWVKRYANREEWLHEKDDARQQSLTSQWLTNSETHQEKVLSPEKTEDKFVKKSEFVKPPVENWLEKWG